VAAPSANRFGRVSPTTAAHVLDEFGDRSPLILDGGACAVGIGVACVTCGDGCVPGGTADFICALASPIAKKPTTAVAAKT